MTGFIGLGNMAQAIIGGILGKGLVSGSEVTGYDSSPAARENAARKHGILIAESNSDVVKASDIIVLAVKPQVIGAVIEEIADAADGEKLFISIAPGKTVEWLTGIFGRQVKIVRCMPNTPALVEEGMTGFCVSSSVTDADRERALEILTSFGKAREVPEQLMAAVTSVSGSAPAYVFILIEAMADQAVADGMTRPQAYEFAAQAVLGSAKMVLETGRHPAELKDMVCSPGGTTIEAVKVLERAGFRSAVEDAMAACTSRAREI